MILHHKFWGVTLMELLVVVAIVGILATLGYSSYSRLKTESRRDDARSALISTEAIIERYLAENNKDNLTSSDLDLTQFENYKSSSSTPILSNGNYYRITIDTGSSGYTISATATVDDTLTSCSSSANASKGQCSDTACRVIYIENGEHKSRNSAGTVANAATTTCW
jgi:type IV pilus assembly protein PilE